MTRKALTDSANIKPAYGYIIEEEGQNITLKTLIQIANALGCHPRDIMPDVPDQHDLADENRRLKEVLEGLLPLFDQLGSYATPVRELLGVEAARILKPAERDDGLE